MYKYFFKRFFDFVFSSVLLPLVLFVILIVAILIKLEDKGPAFYLADRLGKDKKVFKMYKLRSMKVNAPDIRNSDGSTYNSSDDFRLTRTGKFIRKTSIDEIPQIINVFLGNMSFVGPRPDLPDAINLYKDNEIAKLSVKPGITGYNQAYFRNSVNQNERFQNDLRYINRISILTDLKIVFFTIINIFIRKNINITGEIEVNEHDKRRKY